MGYTALIHKNVALAFKLIGDLKTPMVLQKAGEKGFDFGSALVTTAGVDEFNVEGFLFDKKRTSSKENVFKATVLFKAPQVVDLTIYDVLQSGDEVWKIDTVFSTDGFITMASVSMAVT